MLKLYNKNSIPSRTSPLTLLLLIDLLHKMGGAERNLYLLASGLRSRGHNVIIGTIVGGELSTKMHHEGFHIYDLKLTRIYDFNGIKALFKMIRIVKREKVSVIMSYHKSADYLGLLIALLTRKPIISSRRDSGFQLRARHIWLYRLVNRFYDQITAVSESVKEFIVNTQWSKPCDIMVIPNGVPLDSNPHVPPDRRIGIEVDADCVNICCLANIRSIKGQKYTVKAASFVASRAPSTRFYLIGATNIDSKYFKEVKRKVEDLGLQDKVKFTGEVPSDQVPSFLALMDISLSSSLSEGMSNALLESMAMGKPVIATNVGGNPEIVIEGKTGYLVPPENSQAMAEALLKLIDDPQLRHDLGRQGRSLLESKFSIIRMLDRNEDLLQYLYLKRKICKSNFLLSYLVNRIGRIRLRTRIFVAYISYYIGLVTAYRWIKRVFRLGRVKILCLHDISDLADSNSSFSISISPTIFARFLDYVTQNYRVVDLQEAVELLRNGNSLTHDVFALTFDDCYKGWIDHVLPACQRLQVPFATFVTTQPLRTGKPLLYDALIFLAQNTWRKVADLSPWQMGVFLLTDYRMIYHFVEEIHGYWKKRDKKDRDRFLQKLSEYLGVSLNSPECQSMLLDWDDVHRLYADGVTIGAHTDSHSSLDYLSFKECASEIYDSKKELESKLRSSISFFAYPYGVLDNRINDITKMVEKAGFSNAFTLGPNRLDKYQSFQIPRRSVSRGLCQGPNGKFHKPLLAYELCGLGDILFGRYLRWRKWNAKLPHPY